MTIPALVDEERMHQVSSCVKQSVEPQVADRMNRHIRELELDYKLEQERLNTEIDKALIQYSSKGGGRGGNRPDAKLLLQDSRTDYWPVLIEYKGYPDKLEKLDSSGHVQNTKTNNQPHIQNIRNYAVNGAVHYANALLHYTSYENIIAIGVTGGRNGVADDIDICIGVYLVSKKNLGVGQKIGDFKDLSFLKKENFNDFVRDVKDLGLSPENLAALKGQREKEMDASLVKLNNDIYQQEKGLSESDRVYLVAAAIMANLGVPGKVKPLENEDLRSSNEEGNTDGDIMLRKINSFLSEKRLPVDKKKMIVRTLQNTLLSTTINKITDGETQLKRVFTKIVDDLGIYYKIGLSTDFTGKLFNEMYSWLGFTQDKLNDVVLTPSYVATLLVKLARVDKDSYVWDFATGSAGLLVAAMNEMIADAKRRITSPDELAAKTAHIKAEQLLGLEVLHNIYMLTVLNMIMMGDGSSKLLNEDSLRSFKNDEHNFPANAFILNPPYSAEGNGMVFVRKALSMMDTGYAAIIIQSSAGSGKAKYINR
ncbi:N-6 DNA methylase [Corynebacterium mastitidis]